MKYNFEIDFYQLEKLVECSWSATTIVQYMILQDLIDKHFYSMNETQKKAIFSFFETKLNFEKALYNSDTNEIREKIIARYDKNKQYILLDEVGRKTKSVYFNYKNKFWKNSLECIENNLLINEDEKTIRHDIVPEIIN
jgi:hypothetical protein